MADDLELDDDGWDERPPPVTAVAIRVEEDVVGAVRELAEPLGVTPAELMRRWVLERLAAERSPAVKKAPAKKAPAKRKAAPAKKVPAKKKAAAKKR